MGLQRSGSCLAVRRTPEDSNLSDDGVEQVDPVTWRGGGSRAVDLRYSATDGGRYHERILNFCSSSRGADLVCYNTPEPMSRR